MSLWLKIRDADSVHGRTYIEYIVLKQMAMTKVQQQTQMQMQKQKQKQRKLLRLVIRQLSGSSLKMLSGKKQRNATGAGYGLFEMA